ncbi:MAG: hypothetical protein KDA44_05415 [Planctomycetales bacterium]|nr:hypothetical protein [Planctomycetales bacterium]
MANNHENRSLRLIDWLPCAFLGFASLLFIWNSIAETLDSAGQLGLSPISITANLLIDPTFMIELALCAVAGRWLWRLRKKKESLSLVEAPILSPWKFAGALLTLTPLLTLAVFTFAATSFCFWLGPWYRW